MWVNIGQSTLEGKDAVVAACDTATAQMATTTDQFTRFIVAADEDTAAVDVIGHYVGTEGSFVVASCDFYEFRDGEVVRITSYTALLPTD